MKQKNWRLLAKTFQSVSTKLRHKLMLQYWRMVLVIKTL